MPNPGHKQHKGRGKAVHVTRDTPYGVVGITVLPDGDEFWAVLVDAPEALRHGCPTVATGFTEEDALGVLEVSILRYITKHQQLQQPRKPKAEVVVERRRPQDSLARSRAK
jgi:hypothetical protein